MTATIVYQPAPDTDAFWTVAEDGGVIDRYMTFAEARKDWPEAIYALPMPGEPTPDGRTVIASCFGSDEEGVNHLLVLNAEAPYYSQLQLHWQTGEIVWAVRHDNIIPAAKAYQDESGAA